VDSEIGALSDLDANAEQPKKRQRAATKEKRVASVRKGKKIK